MGKLLNLIRGLSGIQKIVLAVVVVGAVSGVSYGAVAAGNGGGKSLLAADEERLPVQRGDLVTQVSTSGSLVFPTKESLVFGVQGTVEEVMVQEGDTVAEGAPLAKLDAATVASLAKTAAQAEVALKTAQDALNTQKIKAALDKAQAEAAVANAQVSVQNAQTELDKARNATTTNVANAKRKLESAKTAVTNAQRDLTLTEDKQAAAVKAAKEALNASTADYSGTFEKWLGITLTADETRQTPDALFAKWNVDLDRLFPAAGRFSDFNTAYQSAGPPADDPSTPWSEPVLYTWHNFYPGAIMATCSDGVVPDQAICVRQDFDTAWTAQSTAVNAYDDAVAKQANDTLTAQNKLATAEDALVDAQSDLDALLAGAGDLTVAAKEKQLAVAKASLAKAEADLAALAGGEALDEALKKAEFEAAQKTLEAALVRLDASTLKAPFAGVVSAVNVSVGDTVGANTVAVEVVDPTVAQLNGVVDEIDVLLISQGMQAVVSLDALRGVPLLGTVSSVSATAQNQQGVVTYPIQIRVQAPPQMTLREGLSATANIVLRETSDVILVPSQAIFGPFDAPVVHVVANGKIIERPVVLGDTDGFWTAVESGLDEGEEIVVDRSAAGQRLPQQQNVLQELRRQLQGGAGPGGRGFREFQGGQRPGGFGGQGGTGGQGGARRGS